MQIGDENRRCKSTRVTSPLSLKSIAIPCAYEVQIIVFLWRNSSCSFVSQNYTLSHRSKHSWLGHSHDYRNGGRKQSRNRSTRELWRWVSHIIEKIFDEVSKHSAPGIQHQYMPLAYFDLTFVLFCGISYFYSFDRLPFMGDFLSSAQV